MLNDEFSNEPTRQVFYLRLIIIIAIFLVVVRLFYLQVVKYKYYKGLASGNVIRLVKLEPVRGKIITADGVIVAGNKPTFNVYFRYSKRVDKREIELLSSILGKDTRKLFTLIKPKRAKILIAQNVDQETILRLYTHQKELSSVSVDIKPRRYYPYPFSFAHITGYLAQVHTKEENRVYSTGEIVGKMAVEKKYDKYLRGKKGYREILVDASGKKIKVLSEDKPISGKDIVLTINWQLQNYIYQAMQEFKGTVVVLDPRDGKILAMVSKPSYDPNLFISPVNKSKLNDIFKSNRGVLENKAIRGLYPPGSVLKPFIAAAALDLGIINDKEEVNCPYSINVGIREYCDWKHGGFGEISVYKAIEGSSDVFFYLLGLQMGINNIDYYLYKFGFGRKCGLCDCEHKGIIPSPEWKLRKTGEKWYLGDTVSTVIGQGYTLVTPLQMAVAYAALANGGIIYRPYIVSLMGNKKIPTTIRWHIRKNKKVFDIVRKAMYLVVNGDSGTGKRARINGWDICGKTGTSQVISRLVAIDKFTNKKFMPHSWFASFAPMNNPQVVVVTLIEHGGAGGKAATLLTKKVYEKLIELGYLKKDNQSI
ncbi:MAG: penicillin-binding protein 2 [Deltaproteobacteria bacterium]|nr:penicillin-binding protein 2 [Deltaproteobacteria bacterium]